MGRPVHHRDAPAGAGGHDRWGLVRAREGGHRLRPHTLEHRLEIVEEEPVRKAVALRVLAVKSGVRIGDAHDLDVRALLRLSQESLDVAVHESGHGDAQRLGADVHRGRQEDEKKRPGQGRGST